MTYGVKLDPTPIGGDLTVRDLVDQHLYAYNGARLREACQLFARKIAQPGVTVGLTLSMAYLDAPLGRWVVSRGLSCAGPCRPRTRGTP